MRHTIHFISILAFFGIYNAHGSVVFIKPTITSPIVEAALADVSILLKKANQTTSLNNNEVKLEIRLPELRYRLKKENIDSASKKENYNWKKITQGDKVVLILQAESPKGIANGLYGLLQEEFGFKFYHPKNTLIPDLNSFDFAKLKELKGEKAFDKMGFHLHTMHPTELTEYLLNEKGDSALFFVKQYIDWLARNGQNYMEFNLLESIHRKTWIAHARAITAYGHSRGIFMGVDISMHMLQQKAFQLYKNFPASFRSKEQQITKSADWLSEAGFDVWNVELSATEFTAGNEQRKARLLAHLQTITKQHGVKIMSRAHVVKKSEMLGNKKEEKLLSTDHGLMIHTVMFYSLTDSNAPVYRNKNLRHMYDLLLTEKERRETWYYPETAYWVTFDNSVPMLLLPYLSARLSDIELCDSLGIDGHLVFSSGWEWGYWLFDWSVARWTWNFTKDNQAVAKYPLQYINELTTKESFKLLLKNELTLQEEYIKNQDLIKVMDAQTITDEIGGAFNIEFHPRPKYSYKYIRNKASLAELEEVSSIYSEKLFSFYYQSKDNLNSTNPKFLNNREREIFDGLKITQLRALHRYHTLGYTISFRKNKLMGQKKDITSLEEAVEVRLEALEIVKNRESSYRYPLKLIAQKRKDKTSYHFGYLYPVSNLHFWEREEGQSLRNKYNILYKNIWNVPRIIGIID